VEVTWRNETSDYRDVFCGNSAALLDVDDRNYEPEEDGVYIEDNPTCGVGIGLGEERTETLAFEVPKGRKVAGIALWNGSDREDFLGETYVVALLDSALGAPPPVPPGPPARPS